MAVTVETKFLKSHPATSRGPQVIYPSYKSFDEFIDVEHLRSLDHYVADRIRRHIKAGQDSFFVNEHRLDGATPYQPGIREVWLSRTKAGVPYNYLDLDRPELWERTEAATEFTLLMEFIELLPFEATGRMLIIYDDGGRAVPAHRDHDRTEICNEFVWFRTNLRKPFYLLNNETNEKQYVESYSAWFDSVNQFHGSEPADGLTFSIRVDGVFTEEFRNSIPTPQTNAASTPSYWAVMTGVSG